MCKLKFYSFRSKLSTNTFQAHPIDLDDDSKIDYFKLIIGNYKEFSFPIVFKHEYGKNMHDILDTGWPSLYLISKNLKNILEENSFNGWNTFDIKLYDKLDNEINDYFGFSVIGRCGKIHHNKNNFFFKKIIPNGNLVKYYKGLEFDIKEWDGNDFFIPINHFGIIVKEEVFFRLKKSKISNLILENIDDIEIPDFATK
jgi:hypothetical protein